MWISKRSVLAATLAGLAACSKPSPGQTGGCPDCNDAGPDGSAAGSTDLPMATITRAATLIYNDIGTDAIASDITQVFAALGIPELAAADIAAVVAARAAGRIYALDVTDQVIASAMASQLVVSIDSFVADLSALGAVSPGTNTPITRADLSAGFTSVASDAIVPRDHLLVALVMALGRERASRRDAGITDPVFGDDLLDPLQLALLYADLRPPDPATMASPSLRPSPPPGGEGGLELGKAGGDIAVEVGLDFLGRYVKVPIGAAQSLTEVVCAPIFLWGYKLSLALDPAVVYRKALDDASQPDASDDTATLVWNFIPSTNEVATTLREGAGCGELPPLGAAPGKTIEWSANAVLQPHGFLKDVIATTDANGKSTATFQTYNDLIPKVFRRPDHEHTAAGFIAVRASGVVPEFKNLEIFANSNCHPGSCSRADFKELDVHFFTLPELYAHITIQIIKTNAWEHGDQSITTLMATVPLDPGSDTTTTPDHPFASGALTFAPQQYDVTYTSPSGCVKFVSNSDVGAVPLMTAGVIMSGLADSDSMPFYMMPSNPSEVWNVAGSEGNHMCGPAQQVNLPTSQGLDLWLAMHQDEQQGAPVMIGNQFMLYRLASQPWTQVGDGVLEMIYNRTSTTFPGLSEHTVIDLSTSP